MWQKATRPAFLSTRFGRRLFVAFMGAALLPILCLAGLAYQQVAGELRAQADDRLHQAARATGMELVRRLVLRAERLGEGALDPSFDAVVERAVDGTTEVLAGDPSQIADRAPVVRPRGVGPRLVVQTLPDSPPELWLETQAGDGGRWRLARLRLDDLFALSSNDMLPTQGEFLVSTGPRLLATSLGGGLDAAPGWEDAFPPRRLFEWQRDGTRYLGRAWPLFLDASLQTEPWNVVVLVPRDVVLAPLGAFRRGFAAIVLVTLLAVPLVATRLIRRRLVPLEQLAEAARRIGRRELDVRVPVDGDDEFADVGRAFNAMAVGVRVHVVSMDQLVRIDREILAAEDAGALAGVLTRSAFSLASCDATAVILAPDAAAEPLPACLVLGSDGTVRHFWPEGELPRGEGDWLDLDVDASPALGPVSALGMRHVRAVPMRAGAEDLGTLLLLRTGAPFGTAERAIYVRQLADQAAAALATLRERERNRELAYFDGLTGLPNRLMFQERLSRALALAPRQKRRVAVCLIAVQGLRRINQTLGHHAGESLLREVAERLIRANQAGDAFRLGGDEFAVLLPELEGPDGAARVAQCVLDCFARPHVVQGQEVVLGAQVGIAVHPLDGHTGELLLRNADAATRTLRSGSSGYRFYSPELNAAARSNLGLEAQLRRAIREQALSLAYQPILDVASGELVAAEALLRWESAPPGVHTGHLVAVAEESGLIEEIGAWALGRACRDLRAWLEGGLPGIQVHVNVSARQLEDDALLGTLRQTLSATAVPAALLSLELTESVFTAGDTAMLARMRKVRELGAGLAIDDFGTGYASLAYVRSFPVDTLKIDRAFIERVDADDSDAAIVRAVLAMAEGLGLRVVAEGVERESQLAMLRRLGCDEAQGFLFSPALAEDAFRKLLVERAERGEVRERR